MGIRITRLTRFVAAGLSAIMLFTAAACGASTAETEPDSKKSVPKPTGPINVVASINQWGSLATELGGDDVTVTSIMNSTNVEAHDFEPKTSDVAKLSKAQIVVANGAGYDSWATKALSKSSTLVSAASVMGATEGDNPHLWFSKDARSSVAAAITDAYIKALPSKKKAFQKRLKAWQNSEKSMESWVNDFTKTHTNLTYAATEPVAYYLMSDLGFKDTTPKGYAQSTASGGEPAPADLQAFQTLVEGKGADVVINNTQEASDATNMITGTAGRSDVPVVDVSEQMPEDVTTLNAWINQLINTIIDAVDPTYGCDSNADADGSTEGDTSGEDSTSNQAQTQAPDQSDSTTDADTKYIRECKAANTGSNGDSDTETNDNGSTTGPEGDVPSNEGQTDPGK